ncbi:MAG: GldG family protein [Magnetococcales bacterium]|nr:GldG family protein [Magnetococcales bacterium]
MKMNRSVRRGLRIQNATTGLLLTLVLAMVAYATQRYTVRWDMTADGRHTLAEQSVKAISAFDDGVVATVYAQDQDNKRATIADLLERYREANPDLTVRFVDPDLDPGAAKRDDVAMYGTVVLRAGEKSEKVTDVDEEAITNALIRLAKGSVKKILFVTGHGEHSIEGRDRTAYSQVAMLLKGEGYGVETVMLAGVEKVPEDTSVVVMGGLRKPLLPVERERLMAWATEKGRVLVLADPDAKTGLEEPLAERGITLSQGIVIDTVSRLFGGGPTTPLVSQYDKEHPITASVQSASFLPEARAILLDEAVIKESAITSTTILQGADRGWLERGDISSGSVGFDAESDQKGPLTLGVALEKGKERWVVVGDSDFAADAYVEFSGNGDLFLNMVRWLAEDEDFIAIKPKKIQDSDLEMNAVDVALLFWGFVVLLPLLILGFGVTIWLRRKRR